MSNRRDANDGRISRQDWQCCDFQENYEPFSDSKIPYVSEQSDLSEKFTQVREPRLDYSRRYVKDASFFFDKTAPIVPICSSRPENRSIENVHSSGIRRVDILESLTSWKCCFTCGGRPKDHPPSSNKRRLQGLCGETFQNFDQRLFELRLE